MSARERCSVIATSRPPASSARPLSALQVDARIDPRLETAANDGVDIRVQAHGELADDRPLVQLLNAVEPRERLARIVRPRQQELAQLDDPGPPEPRQVDDPGQRVEGLRRADVRGGFLAADVLLAGLQRQHEPPLPVHVQSLSGDSPGHAPQILLAGGEQAEGRAAEVEAVAERLALPHGDVDAALARRPEDAERDGIDLADHDGTPAGVRRPGGLGGGAQGLRVLHGAVEVGLGEDGCARVGIDGALPLVRVGGAV